MTVAELFDSQHFQLNWAEQELAQYGAVVDEPALAISDSDDLRLLVATAIGIVDLHLSRSGPRSISTYSSSGRLWPWPDIGAIEITTESHPPQPEFGRDQWWTVMSLTIAQIDFSARSDDDPRIRGLADFALEAARRSAFVPGTTHAASSHASNTP
jgi:hypothetical protein